MWEGRYYHPPAPHSYSETVLKEETSSVYSQEEQQSVGFSVVEYEYYDERGNRIDPADAQGHHIIVDEEDADPDGEEYTDAGVLESKRKGIIRQLSTLPVSERLYAQRTYTTPASSAEDRRVMKWS